MRTEPGRDNARTTGRLTAHKTSPPPQRQIQNAHGGMQTCTRRHRSATFRTGIPPYRHIRRAPIHLKHGHAEAFSSSRQNDTHEHTETTTARADEHQRPPTYRTNMHTEMQPLPTARKPGTGQWTPRVQTPSIPRFPRALGGGIGLLSDHNYRPLGARRNMTRSNFPDIPGFDLYAPWRLWKRQTQGPFENTGHLDGETKLVM